MLLISCLTRSLFPTVHFRRLFNATWMFLAYPPPAPFFVVVDQLANKDLYHIFKDQAGAQICRICISPCPIGIAATQSPFGPFSKLFYIFATEYLCCYCFIVFRPFSNKFVSLYPCILAPQWFLNPTTPPVKQPQAKPTASAITPQK